MTPGDPKGVVRRGYDVISHAYRSDNAADGSYRRWITQFQRYLPTHDARPICILRVSRSPLARHAGDLTCEVGGGPADGVDHLHAARDFDGDLLAVPVVADLQLERVGELPLKLPRQLEHVPARAGR